MVKCDFFSTSQKEKFTEAGDEAESIQKSMQGMVPKNAIKSF